MDKYGRKYKKVGRDLLSWKDVLDIRLSSVGECKRKVRLSDEFKYSYIVDARLKCNQIYIIIK